MAASVTEVHPGCPAIAFASSSISANPDESSAMPTLSGLWRSTSARNRLNRSVRSSGRAERPPCSRIPDESAVSAFSRALPLKPVRGEDSQSTEALYGFMRETMPQLVECVPNFSEGRRRDVIEAIAGEVRQTPGARVLDVQADQSHNRCVITFVGDLRSVSHAALAATRRAVERIDMRSHRGEHPRLGAVDVIPFVPISGVTMEECVAAAKDLGRQIWDALRVPVYFYAEAATRPERRRLPDIRKGEYEGLAAKMADPEWVPDVGDPKPHPTAGAMVVGARRPLIAYNVNLATDDVEVAKKIAKAARESSGGLVAVQAMGVTSERGRAQVSMNLLDYTKTPVHQAFELVRAEAARYGVEILDSEVVGVIPLNAVADAARFYLRLTAFRREQILEAILME